RRAVDDRDGPLRAMRVRIALDPAADTDRRLGYGHHRPAVTDVQLERNDARHQLDDTRAVSRTWPDDWERRYRGEGCVMCAQGRPEENEFGIRVYRSDTADAYLQKADVGQRGYSIVIWRGRHVADVTQLSDSEAGKYWEDVTRVARAVELHFTPAKLHLETLGNEVPH